MSDGCTLWPDLNYKSCCDVHDLAYAAGGTAEDRKKADIALRECVARVRNPVMAWTMYFGVRLVGSKFWPGILPRGPIREFAWSEEEPPTFV